MKNASLYDFLIESWIKKYSWKLNIFEVLKFDWLETNILNLIKFSSNNVHGL